MRDICVLVECRTLWGEPDNTNTWQYTQWAIYASQTKGTSVQCTYATPCECLLPPVNCTQYTDSHYVLSMATKCMLLLFLLQPVSHDTPTGRASLCVSGPLVVLVGVGYSYVHVRSPHHWNRHSTSWRHQFRLQQGHTNRGPTSLVVTMTGATAW